MPRFLSRLPPRQQGELRFRERDLRGQDFGEVVFDYRVDHRGRIVLLNRVDVPVRDAAPQERPRDWSTPCYDS